MLTVRTPIKSNDSIFNLVKLERDNVFKSKTVTINFQDNNSLQFSDWVTMGIRKSRQGLYELYN